MWFFFVRVFDRDGTGFLKRDEFRQMLDFNGFSDTDEGAYLLQRANEVSEVTFFSPICTSTRLKASFSGV